ncbi:MAG: hypothetical protein U0S50_10410 [Sphingopyxis sp.]|uniref:hypothetical protein n=1 Tax=Sphingopyxis sp. TaxID=1908224 RepID=UPI002ABB6618|nr:hypothetical protein [Sphingopyxis sp.]MDZ3832217.1 hypothetical protein [Sphingopyxis sp.]
MTQPRPVLFAALLLGCGTAAFAQPPPEADRPTSEVAEAWIGHDAAELLRQWPVDRGFYQSEDDNTGETIYTYNFGQEAYSYDNPVTQNQMVGTHTSGGVTVPIYQNSVVGYDRIDVPAQHHCTIVFAANEDGVIHRYAYTGVYCRKYAKGWGRPKKRK